MFFDLSRVESTLNYEFASASLCIQAFTRRSYSVENGGENNEVLEFIGDKVLDICVIRLMMEKLASAEKGVLTTRYREGEFTEFKKSIVCSSYLAKRMDDLGLSALMLCGKGDILEDIKNNSSVKEDLFEALIGAVTLDCDWNFDILTDVVGSMLDIDNFFEYGIEEKSLISLIERWAQINHQEIVPSFLDDENVVMCSISIKPLNVIFSSKGKNDAEALKKAYEETFLSLKHMGFNVNKFYMEVGEPSLDDSLRQVNELVQKGLLSLEEIHFEQKEDDMGNLLWICRIKAQEVNNVAVSYSSSKKEAQKAAAFALLNSLKDL